MVKCTFHFLTSISAYWTNEQVTEEKREGAGVGGGGGGTNMHVAVK